MIAVPAVAVESVIDDCVIAGVPAVIVISAGFAETGGAGRLVLGIISDAVGDSSLTAWIDRADNDVVDDTEVRDTAVMHWTKKSQTAGRCTKVGTPGRDILRGTPGRDKICGRGGGDDTGEL